MIISDLFERVSVGETNFYVVDQNDIETLDADELAALETECKAVEDANNAVSMQAKNLQSGYHMCRDHTYSV